MTTATSTQRSQSRALTDENPSPTATTMWAKLRRNENGEIVGWHSLVDHSAGVAAVVEALLAQPTIAKRLAKLAGRSELDAVTRARLTTISFLHDIGKANTGFRARIDESAPPDGHINQLAWVFDGDNNEDVQAQLVAVAGPRMIRLPTSRRPQQ
jgi:CRISPR-associated endonuclease/helicase Cas3